MGTKKYPSALAWVDIETPGLPVGNDFSTIPMLEIAVIVTDFDLKPYFGYQGVVAMNEDIKAALGRPENKAALDMHLASGLLKDSKESTDTVQQLESEIVGMLKNKTSQDKGEFLIAGSGVAAFDHPLLKTQMPELASWFHYAPFDIGIQRRVAYYLSGHRDVVTPIRESFQEGTKAHRALDDVKAHIKEAQTWREFYLKVLADQTAAG